MLKRFEVEQAFDSLSEAKAFQDGIEYVNDSSVTVVHIKERGGQFVVLLRDTCPLSESENEEGYGYGV